MVAKNSLQAQEKGGCVSVQTSRMAIKATQALATLAPRSARFLQSNSSGVYQTARTKWAEIFLSHRDGGYCLSTSIATQWAVVQDCLERARRFIHPDRATDLDPLGPSVRPPSDWGMAEAVSIDGK